MKFIEIRELRIDNIQTITPANKLRHSIGKFINNCFRNNINTELTYKDIDKSKYRKGRHNSLLYTYPNYNTRLISNISGKFTIDVAEIAIKANTPNKATGGDENTPEFPRCNISKWAIILTDLFNNIAESNMSDECRTVIVVFA